MKLIRRRGGDPFAPQLQTTVKHLSYNFCTRIGSLYMPPDCCTDMDGCIELFESIDHGVTRIDTFAGGRKDTVYVRNGKDDWRAI